jgi:hypothetical protein
MAGVMLRRDGSVVWRSGEYAGEPVHCTHCGDPVHWLTRKQIADGEVGAYATMWQHRSMTHGFHLIDHSYNDIGTCKL